MSGVADSCAASKPPFAWNGSVYQNGNVYSRHEGEVYPSRPVHGAGREHLAYKRLLTSQASVLDAGVYVFIQPLLADDVHTSE